MHVPIPSLTPVMKKEGRVSGNFSVNRSNSRIKETTPNTPRTSAIDHYSLPSLALATSSFYYLADRRLHPYVPGPKLKSTISQRQWCRPATPSREGKIFNLLASTGRESLFQLLVVDQSIIISRKEEFHPRSSC